jgi:hypothetical protein
MVETTHEKGSGWNVEMTKPGAKPRIINTFNTEAEA